ncbi:MAG: 3-phosphoshikimate 1-carboxyvinyltransferase [Bacteriovoracaceae bacterium]|nr:3-phosphoshikimate 1-carboxyvinyltransferase [Bacteriovoracaceae bacterium]
MKEIIKRPQSFVGSSILIPGDKSISHRGLILGAIAQGLTEVVDILEGEDVQSTGKCLRALGVKIWKEGRSTWIEGVGRKGFQTPTENLDCGNSGTTMRVMMGVLAGSTIEATLFGDASLSKRPMKRVCGPLREMGAEIILTNENFSPLTIKGSALQGINYELKIASAQIKTAIILAALQAKGTTTIFGEVGSRDHTERLLESFQANIKVSSGEIHIPGSQYLKAAKVIVPSDPSTAAFWIAAAALIPNSQLELQNISLNPTRTGFIEVIKRAGVKIETKTHIQNPEPIGKVRVQHSLLKGFTIEKDEVPSLIDEIPLLAVLATQCEGTTVISGAEELRVKESDRIEAVATNLRSMGAVIETYPDGFKIVGPQTLKGATIKTFHDHRIAMAFSVAGLVADGETIIEDAQCAAVSYPDFYLDLKKLTKENP